MECYLMTRNGVFVPREHTKSQCAHMGHVAYNYRMRLVFPAEAKLDKQNLIIDHTELDRLVVETAASGTCEQMHPNICAAVREHLQSKGIPLDGYKMTINPGPVEGAAYMDYYFVAEQVADKACTLAMLG